MNRRHQRILHVILVAAAAVGLGFFMLQSRVENPSTLAQNKSQGDPFAVQKIYDECESMPARPEKFDCYEKVFGEDIEKYGAKHTLELLDQLQRKGGYVLQECHPLVHKIGNLAYRFYGSVREGSTSFNPVCQSGYYHGLLEEYLAQAKDYDTGIKTACGAYSKENYFDWFQCTHGVGHGVMQYRENDIFKSVKDCDLLDPAGGSQEICYGEVFMENITTDAKTGHVSKFTDPKNPIYPCDAVAMQYKSACYFLSSSMILKLNGYNFENAFKTCETKAEKDFRWLCYQSLGRDVSGSTIRNNEKVRELCLLGNEQGRNECFYGAVRDYINEKGQFDTALELCSFIPENYQDKCYAGIFLDLGLFRKGQDYLQVCAQMPERFRLTCEARVKYD